MKTLWRSSIAIIYDTKGLTMNHRQELLYQFLLMESKNRYVPKEEICIVMAKFYPRRHETSTEHNSSSFSQIRKDIKIINQSGVDKIIISSKEGYKIGTMDETRRYIEARFRRDYASLKRNRGLLKKMGLDGQYRINDDGSLEEVQVYERSM